MPARGRALAPRSWHARVLPRTAACVRRPRTTRAPHARTAARTPTAGAARAPPLSVGGRIAAHPAASAPLPSKGRGHTADARQTRAHNGAPSRGVAQRSRCAGESERRRVECGPLRQAVRARAPSRLASSALHRRARAPASRRARRACARGSGHAVRLAAAPACMVAGRWRWRRARRRLRPTSVGHSSSPRSRWVGWGSRHYCYGGRVYAACAVEWLGGDDQRGRGSGGARW